MAGLIAPDDVTLAYVKGRPSSAKSGCLGDCRAALADCPFSDDDAVFDESGRDQLRPIWRRQVTWGTSPEHGDSGHQAGFRTRPMERSGQENGLPSARWIIWGWSPGHHLAGTPVQRVFIGSCTNSRVSRTLRVAADVAQALDKVADGVRAMIVPGSGLVRAQAESEGLDEVFRAGRF